MHHRMTAHPIWRSAISCTGGQCIQVAAIGNGVAIRDSKNPAGAILVYSTEEWETFVAGAKNGDFDDLV
jgi:hypothetical protein